jgi:hypothetical protein
LITVPGEEVDFIHPGTHQKEKDCTKIEVLSLALASKITTVALRIARNPIRLSNVSVRMAKTASTHSSLPADGIFVITTLILAVP